MIEKTLYEELPVASFNPRSFPVFISSFDESRVKNIPHYKYEPIS
jgi:hypothetical protein